MSEWTPPPNWPAPPTPGWSPPPGWQPDAAWGPAAAGWNFYPGAPPASWVSRHRGASFLAFIVVLVVIVSVVASTGGSHSSTGTGGSSDQAGHVTQSEYGSAWPLTVPSATVACHSPEFVTVTINGTEYALNGLARGADMWPDFDGSGYWKADPTYGHGLKVDISPLIDAGLKLC